MTIEDRIKEVEKEIVININSAEEFGFAKYYPYIKEYTEMLRILKAANRVKTRNSELNSEDF